MARSIALIQNQILDSVAADATLSTLLTSTSKRAIYRLFAFVVAVAINLLEQLLDLYRVNVEAIAASAAPSTAAWLQKQIFNWQYSASNPQVIQFTNFAPVYPIVDSTLRIVSRCSVTTTLSGKVLIKVATGSTPGPLSAPQIAALNAYVNPPNGLGVTGIIYVVSSLSADQLYVSAQIFYQGQYSSVIQVNVIAAINNYLANIPFNGNLKISDLEGAIKAVEGVNDVILTDVKARPDSLPLASATALVSGADVLARLWVTVAGYVISETTAANTLADTLIFTAE